MYCGIHLRVILHEILKISIIDKSLKINILRLQVHLPGADELSPPDTVNPKKHEQGLHFVVFCSVSLLNNLTHILQGYCIGTGAILWLTLW